MEYYFITGTSHGIGKALAEALLMRANARVVGISRTNNITHPQFSFVQTDLSDADQLSGFRFPALNDATKIVLVNNAGALGDVGYVGNIRPANYETVFTLNTTAPAVLSNAFLEGYADKKVPLIIANISSGAGKNPIDGWAAYCASKAALDMFSRVLAEELAISAKKHIRVFAIAPGIVDTEMQSQIRSVKKENFSRVQQFLDYKSDGQLASASLTAHKLLSIFDSPEKFPETLLSLRDIQT